MLESNNSIIKSKISNRSKEFDSIILSLERCIEPWIDKLEFSNPDSTTLLSGLSGISLFYGYAFKKFKDQRFLDRAYDLVNQSVENISLIEQPSLYQGFTGIAWTIRHLTSQGIFDRSSLDVLDDIDRHIEDTIDILASHNYYSLMYGSIGHGVYFSEALKNSTDSNSKDRYTAILKKILYSIDKASIKTKDGITWLDNTSLDFHQSHKVIYNLGLPHGISGIAVFLSTLLDNKIEEELTRKLLDGSLRWLLSRKCNFKGISHYPSLIADTEPAKMARLCWAYGDLCSAFAFLKGYKFLNNELFREEAYETMILSLERTIDTALIHTNPSKNLIHAGLCKGTCGTLMLYNELNEYFQSNVVANRINYWIEETITPQLQKREIGDYKSFMVNEQGQFIWGDDPGFMEGLSGIGLTFLYLSNPKELGDWKRLLLL